MSDQDPSEGGTKLQRRPVQQIPQQVQQIPQQIPQQMPQQIPPQVQQRQMQQQIPPQVQQMQKQQFINNSVPNAIKYGRFNLSNSVVKNSVIVAIIFVLLNSKIIWRALARMPMMGSVEPSILALIVNSILAGVVFYILSKYFNKS